MLEDENGRDFSVIIERAQRLDGIKRTAAAHGPKRKRAVTKPNVRFLSTQSPERPDPNVYTTVRYPRVLPGDLEETFASIKTSLEVVSERPDNLDKSLCDQTEHLSRSVVHALAVPLTFTH